MGIECILYYYITFVRIVKYRRPHSFSFYQILHIPQIRGYPFSQIVDGVKNATVFLCKAAQMRSILISADPLLPVVFL